MRNTQKKRTKEKNQLIAKSIDKPPTPLYVWPIGMIGASLLIISMVWAVALCIKVAPPKDWLLYSPALNLEWENMLFEWSHFGHAIIGPLELATLGTIILSFVHVLHQLRAQEHTEKTRFQPVITCVALLDYTVVGTDQKDKVRIDNPILRLRIRNLGNSPATFMELTFQKFLLKIPQEPIIELTETLKSDFIQIDSLGEHAGGINGTQYDLDLTTKNLDPRITDMLNGILSTDTDAKLGELTITVHISHENVMGLEYTRTGTFVWSSDLSSREKSDREQIDYIEEFRLARSTKEMTIGKFIKRSHPLQAFLRNVRSDVAFQRRPLRIRRSKK